MASSKTSRGGILFVGRPTLDFEMLKSHVGQFGLGCAQVSTAVEALDLLETRAYDLLIIDDTLPEHSAKGLLGELSRQRSCVPVLLLGTTAASLPQWGGEPVFETVAALDKPLSLLQIDHILMSRLTGTGFQTEFATEA